MQVVGDRHVIGALILFGPSQTPLKECFVIIQTGVSRYKKFFKREIFRVVNGVNGNAQKIHLPGE